MQKTLNFKKGIAFFIVMAMICAAFISVAVIRNNNDSALAADGETIITLQIDNPNMTVDGRSEEIDPGRGTTPVIVNDRTLVPIRAIIEAVGGTVDWEQNTQTTTLSYNSDAIRLTIDSTTAYLNDEASELDAAPAIINDRTMLPIRFIAESFKFTVGWDEATQTVTVTVPAGEVIPIPEVSEEATEQASVDNQTDDADAPVVYMTTNITPEALLEIYNTLGFNADGNVAVKMSTGEPPNSNYLRPELIKDLVQSVDGTIVESNTAYGGQRAESAKHWQVIKDHGFLDIAEADILDEDGSLEIPVNAAGATIHENYVGAHLENYDSLICLAHFKGHAMAGYGGAIKNMSIGIASSEGKNYIHTGGMKLDSWMGGEQDKFLEAMGDATSAVVDFFDGKVVYVNVMNRLSVDCDCSGNPTEPDMHDIGILASYDPVALDQACLDLIYAQKDGDGASLVNRIESRNGLHTLEHAAEIGLGNREYNLVSIDS